MSLALPRRGERRLPGVSAWVVIAGVVLAALAGCLPLEPALGLPPALILVVAGFIQPFLPLVLIILGIPLASLLTVALGGFKVSLVEPLVLLLALGWLARALARRDLRIEGGSLVAPLLGVWAAMLLSLLVAFEFESAASEVVKWTELLVVFLFVADTVRERRQVYLLLGAFFAAGLGEAAFGLFQFATGAGPGFFEVDGFLRAFGTFGQPNPFAGYLATILPLALAVLLAQRVQVPRPLWLLAAAAAALCGLAILVSLSRGTWLAVVVAVGVMLLAWEARTRRLLVPVILLGLIFVLLWVLGVLPAVITERLQVILDNFGVFDVRTVDVTSENFAVVERMAHWQAAWYMFLDHPLLGVGIGNYSIAYDDYHLPGWTDALGHAHNYYLNTLAETGVVGLAALLWLLGTAYRFVLAGIRVAPGGLERAILVAVLGSLAVYTTFSAFDDLLVQGMAMQLGLLLGLAYTARRGWDLARG